PILQLPRVIPVGGHADARAERPDARIVRPPDIAGVMLGHANVDARDVTERRAERRPEIVVAAEVIEVRARSRDARMVRCPVDPAAATLDVVTQNRLP